MPVTVGGKACVRVCVCRGGLVIKALMMLHASEAPRDSRFLGILTLLDLICVWGRGGVYVFVSVRVFVCEVKAAISHFNSTLSPKAGQVMET